VSLVESFPTPTGKKWAGRVCRVFLAVYEQ
jgi:hypothetical protein